MYQYPSLNHVKNIEDLTSAISFTPFYVNQVFEVFISGDRTLGILNTSSNQVVARWDEEGAVKGMNAIIKLSDGDQSIYAVATENGLRLI